MVAFIAAKTMIALSLLAVMAPVRRPKRIFGAAACLVSSSFLAPQLSQGFASLLGSARLSVRPTTSRATAGLDSLQVPYVALPGFTSLPWADDLEGKDALAHAPRDKAAAFSLEDFDMKLVEGLSIQELHEYNRALIDLIAEVKGKIAEQESVVLRNAMGVQSESQVLWLESMMQTIGDLRGQLRRVRDRERQLEGSIAKREGGFLQTLMRAVALGFGGQKAVPGNVYPASGVSSYTM
jgi:hypothetical protein